MYTITTDSGLCFLCPLGSACALCSFQLHSLKGFAGGCGFGFADFGGMALLVVAAFDGAFAASWEVGAA